MEQKERRAQRIEEIKAALLEAFIRNNPDAPKGMKVEMSADAAIDMFGLGILDSPDEDWNELVESLKVAKPEPLDEDSLTDEQRERVNRNAKRVHRTP